MYPAEKHPRTVVFDSTGFKRYLPAADFAELKAAVLRGDDFWEGYDYYESHLLLRLRSVTDVCLVTAESVENVRLNEEASKQLELLG